MTTPPGWYPEPGHTGNGPALERWWDGAAWSEYTRTAQAPADQAGTPGIPSYASYAPYPGGVPARPARRGGVIAIGVAAVLVLVGGVVGGVVMLKDSGGDKGADQAAPSASASRSPGDRPSGAPDAPSQGPEPKTSGVVVDALDRISLPILPGWQGTTGASGAGLTIGRYPCEVDPTKNCVRGGVFSVPAAAVKLKSTTPEAAAKEDIPVNAEQSYAGGLTSHKELLSQPVTVAGQRGYLVRWQVVTKVGDDGYVQSLVFPSPSDPKQLVLVRYGFDINAQAPGLDVMDTITQGIKGATGSGGTGGTGV